MSILEIRYSPVKSLRQNRKKIIKKIEDNSPDLKSLKTEKVPPEGMKKAHN